jgi:hypothetical protein
MSHQLWLRQKFLQKETKIRKRELAGLSCDPSLCLLAKAFGVAFCSSFLEPTFRYRVRVVISERECDTYVPRTPLTRQGYCRGVWIFYTLFVVAAFFLEKIGKRKQINSR